MTLAASGPAQDIAVSRPKCLWPFPAVRHCLHHSDPFPTRMGLCLLSWCPSHVRSLSLHICVCIYNRTCCCCCWVSSVVSDSLRPHRRQPTRLPHPWDSPGKNTGVGCISFSNAWKWKVKMKSLSRVRLFTTPWTAAHQAPPSMGFSRQEYWSGGAIAFSNRTWEVPKLWLTCVSRSQFSSLSSIRSHVRRLVAFQ